MIKLLKNEWIKLSKKKSFLILFFVVALVIFVNTLIAKNANTETSNYSYYSYYYDNPQFLEQNLSSINKYSKEDYSYYIQLKADLKIVDLMKKYGKSSWQAYMLETRYQSDIMAFVEFEEFGKISDYTSEAEIKQNYEKLISSLDGDWKNIAQTEKDEYLSQKKDLETKYDTTVDKLEKENISKQIFDIDLQIESIELRFTYDAEYGYNFKSRAISDYVAAKSTQESIKKKETLKHSDKRELQVAEETEAMSLQTLKEGIDQYKPDEARGLIKEVVSSNAQVIIIILIVFAAGIITDEFNKGTIKLLLIKPYTRTKILFAKFILILLLIPLFFLFAAVVQFVFAGLFFGLESLSIPIWVYDFANHTIVNYNWFTYILKDFLCTLPMVLLLVTLAFSIATISLSNVFAIIVSIMGLLAGEVIYMFAVSYNLAWLQLTPTMNWNLAEFSYGKLGIFSGMNTMSAIIICIIYFVIMLVVSKVVFKKHNIHNI